MKIGPKYKICRRLGSRIFGKCQTTKFSVSGTERKPSGKGGKGGRPRGASEYGLQLIEKQKARFSYGLKERQMASYVKAARTRRGDPVFNLFKSLENRLDNVVYRLGLALTRPFARQLVSHGHITVNGRRLNIPSYQVKTGEVVAIRPQSQTAVMFQTLAERQKDHQPPAWLARMEDGRGGKVSAEPLVSELPADISFSSILEYYSRV